MNRLKKLLSYGYINTLFVFIALVLLFYFFTPNHISVSPRNKKAVSKLIT